jgi:hypothetical protein
MNRSFVPHHIRHGYHGHEGQPMESAHHGRWCDLALSQPLAGRASQLETGDIGTVAMAGFERVDGLERAIEPRGG